MTSPPTLQAEALVVHLFVAADGEHRVADHRYLLTMWQACGATLGMREAIPGLAKDPRQNQGIVTDQQGVLAGRSRPGPGMHQAVLRREHDTLCLTVMREPAPADGIGWTELDRDWTDVAGQPSPGVIGSARLFLARLVDPGAPAPEPGLAAAVRQRCPADPAAAPAWWQRGVVVAQGFAVWEASTPEDGRIQRRIIVVAANDRDPELSAWTWAAGDQELTRFARYLLHAAKLRYQRRVWGDGQGFRQVRQEADRTVRRLLGMVAPQQQRRRDPSQAELLEASRELALLQARELGLVQTSTSLREMRRTVDIAAANLTALTGDDQLNGRFADDRSLAAWFGQQLDDDATYLEAARERATQVGAVIDQLVQRGQQRRQERFNLGLTGVIGAILMSLAAIQSLMYTVPLPPLVKPGVITTLGTLALFASLVVLRLAVPARRWSLARVWAGFGATTAAAPWVGVAAIAGAGVTPAGTWLWAGGGFLAGVSAAASVTLLRR